MVEGLGCSLRYILPVDGFYDGFAQLIATLAGLGAGFVESTNKAALVHEFVHAGLAHYQTAAINPPCSQKLGKRFAHRLCNVAVPLAQALEWILVLGIKNQDGSGGLIHKELVDQAVV